MPQESPPPRRHRRWPVAVAAVVAAAAFGLYAFHAGKTPVPAARPAPPVPVSVATAKRADVDITLSALGTVTPLATVTIKTQINGQLTHIAFGEGQTVKAGDFLAQIDPRPYQAQLDQSLGTLAHDQALLDAARVDLARYRKLAAQDSIATQQLDTQAALVKQYEGQVTTDHAQVTTAKLNLTYCHITAPTDGRVGLRQVDQGNYVQTSDAGGIVVLTQMQPITVVFSVPEDNLPVILRRLHTGAVLFGDAYDRAETTKLGEGWLTSIDNEIDTATGTVKLRAEFDNADEALFPNQFVNLHLRVDTLRNATVVPTAAIQRGAPGAFVYLVKPNKTVTVRPVVLGAGAHDLVSVQSGLQPDDVVVIDGADKLREGAAVVLSAPTPAKTAEAVDATSKISDGTKPSQDHDDQPKTHRSAP